MTITFLVNNITSFKSDLISDEVKILAFEVTEANSMMVFHFKIRGQTKDFQPVCFQLVESFGTSFLTDFALQYHGDNGMQKCPYKILSLFEELI